MDKTDVQAPQQSRSQQTLDRILSSGATLIGEKSYENVSIAEIASRAQISVGGFYARFRNKDALFGALQNQLGRETQERIDVAAARDWSRTSLRDLLLFIVRNNADLYERYRGVLMAVHIESRIVKHDSNDSGRNQYNAKIVDRIEQLLLRKREQIQHRQVKAAIRTSIACMTAMLRDAIVFTDTSLYPKPGNNAVITRRVADVMHRYLTAESL